MFPILKNSVLYFSVLSYTYAPPTHADETKILDSEELAKKEIAPIINHFNQIMHADNRNATLFLTGNFFGELMALGRKAVRDARRVDRLNFEKGRLDKEKDRVDTYQLLLALTFRVDSLEKMLCPGEDLKGQRSKRWMHIFTKNTPAVEDIRSKIHAAGMTELSFAEQVERLIQERNNRAGYANIPLPRLVKETIVERALQIMGITEDDEAVETLKILAAPVKGADFTTTTTKSE